MGSPIPGEFMALIRHNTVRGYNKHREEAQGEMLPVCPASSLLFLLKLRGLCIPAHFCKRPAGLLYCSCSALARMDSTASPGQAEPFTLELAALLKSWEVPPAEYPSLH